NLLMAMSRSRASSGVLWTCTAVLSLSCIAHARFVSVRERDDALNDRLQSGRQCPRGHKVPLTGFNSDSGSDILDGLDQDETVFFRQVPVDRSNGPTEDAVHGNPHRGSFAIHRAAAADHQVRVPYKIQAVFNLRRNRDSTCGYVLLARRPQVSFLAFV